MAANTTRVTFANLSKYDLLQRQWAANLVTTKIGALGKVLNLKGRKDDINALNAVTDAKTGDVWMVGASGSDSFEEYFYTEDGKWEFMGVTRASLEGYVTETDLYKGVDGTGTAAAPADGTVLAAITAMISTNASDIDAVEGRLDTAESDITAIKGRLDTAESDINAVEQKASDNEAAITAINASDTGILAQAKTYADGLVAGDSAIGQRVAALEVELTDEDITNMFNTNTASLTA